MTFQKYIFWACNFLLFLYLTGGVFFSTNWVYFIISVMLVVLSVVFMSVARLNFVPVLTCLFPLIFYFFYFIVSASWALYPFQAVYYIVNDSVYFFAALLFAFNARHNSFEEMIKMFRIASYSAIIVTCLLWIKSSNIEQLGGYSAPVLGVAFPYLFIYQSKSIVKKYIPILLALAILIVCASRTPLICAIVGTFLTTLFTEKRVLKIIAKVVKLSSMLIAVFSILLFVPVIREFMIRLIFKFTSYDIGYTAGELNRGVDETRWSIYTEAMNVYSGFWFQGMGYMNFMQWYGDKLGVYSESSNGKEIIGVNLHNSYQTWALEGGLICLIIIGYLFYKYIIISIARIKQSETYYERSFHIVGLISLVSFAIFASFHQLHQTIIFFIIIGIVFGAKKNNHVISTKT